MNNNFTESTNKLKEALKGLINENSSSEDINKVQELTNLLEGVEAEHKKAENEISSLKDIIIRNVNNSGNNEEPFDSSQGDTKSLDDILLSAGEKIIKERRK